MHDSLVQPTATPPDEPATTRRSSSARAVLQALALLARSPDGLRADEAALALGRSVSTAYSLLDSLVQEGFALHDQRGSYRLAAGAETTVATTAPTASGSLTAVLDALYARTNKRAYLAAAHHGELVIPATRGRQGMRRMPGIGRRIGDHAHALALGKVALSMLSPEALDAYIDRGLKACTPRTVTCPDTLRAELDDVRLSGVACDVEEHLADFCCLASAVHDDRGRAVAVVGISMSRRSFEQQRVELTGTLREVAGNARISLGGGARTALPENGSAS